MTVATTRIPTTVHLVSSAAARAMIKSARTSLVILDCRPLALYVLEHVRQSLHISSLSSSTHAATVLVYDAGTTTLSMSCTRAAEAVSKLISLFPYNTRICLIAGGIAAMKMIAPELVEGPDEAGMQHLRTKLRTMQAPAWASESLEACVKAREQAVCILPWLMIGSHTDANAVQKMKRNGISHVMAVGEELCVQFPNNFVYTHIAAKDFATYPLIKHFPYAVTMLRAYAKQVQQGRKLRCLVHCYAGVSRSVAIVAAYLIAEGCSTQDALQFIKEKRSAASPNRGFIQQLHQWYTSLRGDNPPLPLRFSSVVQGDIASMKERVATSVSSLRERAYRRAPGTCPTTLGASAGGTSDSTTSDNLRPLADLTSKPSETDCELRHGHQALSTLEGDAPRTTQASLVCEGRPDVSSSGVSHARAALRDCVSQTEASESAHWCRRRVPSKRTVTSNLRKVLLSELLTDCPAGLQDPCVPFAETGVCPPPDDFGDSTEPDGQESGLATRDACVQLSSQCISHDNTLSSQQRSVHDLPCSHKR